MFTGAALTIEETRKQPKCPLTEECINIRNGILLSHKKEWNVICSNIVGPRDYHTKWSKSDKDISYDIAYMWYLKKNGANEHIYKTESHKCRKQTYGYQSCKQGGGDKLGDWD